MSTANDEEHNGAMIEASYRVYRRLRGEVTACVVDNVDNAISQFRSGVARQMLVPAGQAPNGERHIYVAMADTLPTPFFHFPELCAPQGARRGTSARFN